MPRANRNFLSGHIWHITQRCHQKEFLLKFAKDRQRWLHWLFKAKQRYGLCVLNYVVTSNHIHLLVKDTGGCVIPRSLQLVAGRTGQEYNKRKGRTGAYWEDRYHATAIGVDAHLFQCLVYIDLNMVRAGAVRHPKDWVQGGYRELQAPPARYGIIAMPALMALCGASSISDLQEQRRAWVEQALQGEQSKRDETWSESIAVGDEAFIEGIKSSLVVTALNKQVTSYQGSDAIKEKPVPYSPYFDSNRGILRGNNRHKWDIN